MKEINKKIVTIFMLMVTAGLTHGITINGDPYFKHDGATEAMLNKTFTCSTPEGVLVSDYLVLTKATRIAPKEVIITGQKGEKFKFPVLYTYTYPGAITDLKVIRECPRLNLSDFQLLRIERLFKIVYDQGKIGCTYVNEGIIPAERACRLPIQRKGRPLLIVGHNREDIESNNLHKVLGYNTLLTIDKDTELYGLGWTKGKNIAVPNVNVRYKQYNRYDRNAGLFIKSEQGGIELLGLIGRSIDNTTTVDLLTPEVNEWIDKVIERDRFRGKEHILGDKANEILDRPVDIRSILSQNKIDCTLLKNIENGSSSTFPSVVALNGDNYGKGKDKEKEKEKESYIEKGDDEPSTVDEMEIEPSGSSNQESKINVDVVTKSFDEVVASDHRASLLREISPDFLNRMSQNDDRATIFIPTSRAMSLLPTKVLDNLMQNYKTANGSRFQDFFIESHIVEGKIIDPNNDRNEIFTTKNGMELAIGIDSEENKLVVVGDGMKAHVVGDPILTQEAIIYFVDAPLFDNNRLKNLRLTRNAYRVLTDEAISPVEDSIYDRLEAREDCKIFANLFKKTGMDGMLKQQATSKGSIAGPLTVLALGDEAMLEIAREFGCSEDFSDMSDDTLEYFVRTFVLTNAGVSVDLSQAIPRFSLGGIHLNSSLKDDQRTYRTLSGDAIRFTDRFIRFVPFNGSRELRAMDYAGSRANIAFDGDATNGTLIVLKKADVVKGSKPLITSSFLERFKNR